jgi:hypothetical protein
MTVGSVGKGIWNLPVIIIVTLVFIMPAGALFMLMLLGGASHYGKLGLALLASLFAMSIFLLVRSGKKPPAKNGP